MDFCIFKEPILVIHHSFQWADYPRNDYFPKLKAVLLFSLYSALCKCEFASFTLALPPLPYNKYCKYHPYLRLQAWWDSRWHSHHWCCWRSSVSPHSLRCRAILCTPLFYVARVVHASSTSSIWTKYYVTHLQVNILWQKFIWEMVLGLMTKLACSHVIKVAPILSTF